MRRVIGYEILCGSYEKGKLGGGFTFRNDAKWLALVVRNSAIKTMSCVRGRIRKLTAAKISVASLISAEDKIVK